MARSKGVPRRKVLYKHALRPSLFSLITLLAINIGFLIGGALVVETFFRIPGLGTAVVEAVLREDFPVVLAIVMIVATAFLVFNYLADLLYGVIDPRVREKEKYETSSRIYFFSSRKRRVEPATETVEAPA